MKFTPIDPPREFETGFASCPVVMRDCGRLVLEPDEQVTLVTPSGAEYDVARKAWGFYATPSLNGRLSQFGLRGVLVKNRIGRYFILLVETEREDDFEEYLAAEGITIVWWLDRTEELERLEKKLNG
ncbi:MAG: hypothetical protein N3B18_12885 [Desulfobacterota bacterium]|nr:hypothetical protein [Thermodesulfobacteriota bacterium]